ncbi:hypothetical protein U9M48_016173 [Paspalum notatum var. saurae]|uniref:Uncharacterized protein n=1 Tax=Paspalum notatum var. saurae TaxID=547442 RepID=A0AAQ3T4X7_PASNO
MKRAPLDFAFSPEAVSVCIPCHRRMAGKVKETKPKGKNSQHLAIMIYCGKS